VSEERAVAAAEALGLARACVAVTQHLGADTIDIATSSGVVIARHRLAADGDRMTSRTALG
jgi:hypothetical protein